MGLTCGADLWTNEVLLGIEHFAFTANNITYAAFGDVVQYWNFFPTETGIIDASAHRQPMAAIYN